MATPASRPGRQDWLTWAALAVCALAVWAVIGGARDFAFVLWDDDHNIQQNAHLSGVTWENLRWMFTDTTYSRRYLPLTWLGWEVEHDLFGLTARSAHLGNILFHLLNTFLVFSVIKAAMRIWLAGKNSAGPLAANTAAAIGALLWALHPLRVEVVAWASGRIYAQAACFLLVAAWCWLRALESAPGSAAARRFRWCAAGALALSLLTYPLALSFVGVLFVLEWSLAGAAAPSPRSGRAEGGAAPTRGVGPVLEKVLPCLVITTVILGLTLWARTNVSAVGWKPPVTLEQFGAGSRFLQACYVWAYYLWKPLLPFDLSPFYTRLLAFSPGDWEFVLSLAVVAAITAGLFLRRTRWPGLWLLWLCHLLVLAPVLGLTEHPHFTNDRYSYLASVLWSVGLAVVLVQLWPRRTLRITVLAAAGAGLVALGLLSLKQTAVWQNTESLGRHMIATMGDHPRRFEIYSRMASALRAEGRLAESNPYYLQSLGGDPSAADRALAQARQLEVQGRPREAFVQYLLAAQLRPELAEPKLRLGSILLADDRAAEALPYLADAVRLEPGSADAQVTLGWALNRAGQAPEAIPHFETALRLSPDEPAAHSGLGTALVTIGRPRESVVHFEQVIRQFPNSAPAHFQLGLALLDGLGRKADAAAQFELVLKLSPEFPGAREALARSRR